MKYENVRLTEAVRRIRMIFVVGVIAACVLYGGKISAFAEDTQEQYDSSQSSYGQLLEQEGDTSGILQFGGQIIEDEASDSSEASLAAANSKKYESAIVGAVEKFSPRLNVKSWGLTTRNVANVVTTAMNAHPEVVYVARYSYLYDQTTGKVVYLKFSYKPNARTEKKQLDAAIAEVNKQINTKNMKPTEIVLAYHEFLTSTVAYDTSGAKEFDPTTGRDHMYDMYGVLVKRSSVCQGYAETMWYFLRKAGVPCGVATSQYVNHAWNVVNIGGKWYHVDATWDDPASDIPGRSMHDYFLVSFDTLNSKTKAASSDYYLGRYDTKVGNVWKGTYSNATDKRYEKGQFWNGVEKVIFYRKGYLYSIKQGSQSSYYQINKYSFTNGVNTTIFTGQDEWLDTDGTALNKQYGTLFLAQEKLYFCTSRYVAWIDLEVNERKAWAIYDIRQKYVSGVNIYGMGYYGNDVVIWVSDTPSCTRKDAYYLGACMSHKWQAGEVTKQPTFTSQGSQKYKCSNCGYTKNVTLDKLKLATVTVKTKNTGKGISLTWNTDSRATGYKVYRRTGKGAYRLIKTVKGSSVRSMVDRSVVGGKTYTYRVSAYNSYTKGGSKAKSQYYIGCTTARAKNTSQGVRVSWKKTKGAAGYKIYKKTGNGRFKCVKVVKAKTTTYLDRRVKSGTKYTYFVKPYKGKTAGTYKKASVKYR